MKMKKDSKLFLKILSAFAAIVLWFAITYTEDPIITQFLTDIDIVFDGEDELHDRGLIIVNKDELPALSAQIRGNRSSVIASVGSVSAVVDLSGLYETGTSSVLVKYSYPTQNVSLAKTKLREITLETEKIVSRDIPVRIEIENADKNTSFISDSKSEVKTVTVRGAESIIYQIAYAKAVVDASDITASSLQTSLYKLYNSKDAVLSENNILYKSDATIPIENTVYKKVTLPVEIVLSEHMAENYALKVKSQSIQSVSAGLSDGVQPASLKAVISDNQGLRESEFKLKITVPEGVYLPEDSLELTAKCEILPLVTKEIEIPVTPENVPEGRKATVVPQKLTVTLRGAEELLIPDNVKAFADAVTSKVRFEPSDGISVIGDYAVTIQYEE